MVFKERGCIVGIALPCCSGALVGADTLITPSDPLKEYGGLIIPIDEFAILAEVEAEAAAATAAAVCCFCKVSLRGVIFFRRPLGLTSDSAVGAVALLCDCIFICCVDLTIKGVDMREGALTADGEDGTCVLLVIRVIRD